MNFTKNPQPELAPSNIQVNAVACDDIDADMNGVLQRGNGYMLKKFLLTIPQKKVSPCGTACGTGLCDRTDHYNCGG